jgi:hypothetical protein
VAVNWLTGSPGGIAEPYEMHGTAQESWANDKLTASVQLRCAWAQRYDVLGNILTFGRQWPYHPDGSPVRAISGTIQPAPADSALDAAGGHGLSYAEALLNVNFESADSEENNGDVVVYSASIEPTAEYLTLPHKGLYWDAAQEEPLKPEEAPGMLQTGFDYKLTYYNLSSIPAAFLTLTGKCNVAAVPTSFFGDLAAETLLYNPPTINRSVSFGTGSGNKWTLSTRLTYKPNEWNKFWRVETRAWSYQYCEDGSVHRAIPTASFAGILPSGILP